MHSRGAPHRGAAPDLQGYTLIGSNMKIPRLVPLAAIAALALMAGCSDPVDPSLETYNGTNGLVADPITFILPDNSVKSYRNLTIDFGKASMEYLDANDIQHAIRLENYTLEKREVTVLLPLPANANGTGEYVWVDGSAPTTTEAYMVLERDDVQYASVTGKTVITKYGPPGSTIEGNFTGTIRNTETRSESQVNGKFMAVRVN
jgi:hypothetical protein